MSRFGKTIPLEQKAKKIFDAYAKWNNKKSDSELLFDGYTESPFAHHSSATATQREKEYFMQAVLPYQLERVSLRTPIGFRGVWGYARDFMNNKLGVKTDLDKDILDMFNRELMTYLKSRKFYDEVEKVVGWEICHGEDILMLYFNDIGMIDDYRFPVSPDEEIVGTEAIKVTDYHIPEFDALGEPKYYEVQVKSEESFWGTVQVTVHPTRVLRRISENIEFRYTGYSRLAVAYDAIVILSTILKAAGEAAFRWGTGHPVIFTKEIYDLTNLERLEAAIGDPTRRTWHVLPSEFVDRIDLLGQAGTMLNLKSLADISIDQVAMAFQIPKPILMGEIAGVVSGSEVNERTYFSKLDADHSNFEPFIIKYFRRDFNVRRIFAKYGVDIIKDWWEIDWGIREVLNKLDQIDYDTKLASYAIALGEVLTVNERRKIMGYEPVPDEAGGDVIVGMLPLMQMEAEAAAMQEANNVKQEGGTATTAKQAGSKKDVNKDKQGQTNPEKIKSRPQSDSMYIRARDAFQEIIDSVGMDGVANKASLHEKTISKILEFVQQEAIV